MSREARIAGITPYVLRLAAHYAALGVGDYRPRGYGWFDTVKVELLMPWKAGETITQSAQVLRVSFMDRGQRRRYVEFSMNPAGFGGEPVMEVLPGGPVVQVVAQRDPAPDEDDGPGDGPAQ